MCPRIDLGTPAWSRNRTRPAIIWTVAAFASSAVVRFRCSQTHSKLHMTLDLNLFLVLIQGDSDQLTACPNARF
jgi:hypothetical protein